MIKSCMLLMCYIFIVGCNEEKSRVHQSHATTVIGDKKITYHIFRNDTMSDKNASGFGYDIMVNGRLLIHQPVVPALSGNDGFKSSEHAEIIARFVVHKLTNNIMPPSITPSDIDSLIQYSE